MLKKIIILLIFFSISIVTVFSYEVDLPGRGDNVSSESSITTTDNDFYIKTSKTINKYLWYMLWTVAFGVVLYAWVILLKAEWVDTELKKANKILIWWLIWIFTSLLAYPIINILINLW